MRTCGRCGAKHAVMVRCPNCRSWLCEGCEWSHDCPAAPEPEPKTPETATPPGPIYIVPDLDAIDCGAGWTDPATGALHAVRYSNGHVVTTWGQYRVCRQCKHASLASEAASDASMPAGVPTVREVPRPRDGGSEYTAPDYPALLSWGAGVLGMVERLKAQRGQQP